MIPSNVKKEIKIAVFRKADEHDYINRTRPENARFMHELVEDVEVGMKLASYREKSSIKTYIKDGILNQYAKQKMRPPSDLAALLQKELHCNCQEIESNRAKKVYLYADSGTTYVVACGAYLKWESALRKGLETAASLKKATVVKIVLVLSIQERHVTAPDMDLTKKVLARISVKCIFVGV